VTAEPAVCDPNWRDNPAALDRLCQQGARELHGEQAEARDTDTIEPKGDYL
jgi:hypothetical protein